MCTAYLDTVHMYVSVQYEPNLTFLHYGRADGRLGGHVAEEPKVAYNHDNSIAIYHVYHVHVYGNMNKYTGKIPLTCRGTHGSI